MLLFHSVEVYSGARCTDDLMSLVVEKNSSRIVLSGLQPSQNYLATASDLWKIDSTHGYQGYYSIKEVGNTLTLIFLTVCWMCRIKIWLSQV